MPIRLTESALRKIIKEELKSLLNENYKVILDYNEELPNTFDSLEDAKEAAYEHNMINKHDKNKEAMYILGPDGTVYDLKGNRRNW